MKKLRIGKLSKEIEELKKQEPIEVKMSAIEAISIITHIQLATRHTMMSDGEISEIGIHLAQRLQKLFRKNSEVGKMLEMSWKPKHKRRTKITT